MSVHPRRWDHTAGPLIAVLRFGTSCPCYTTPRPTDSVCNATSLTRPSKTPTTSLWTQDTCPRCKHELPEKTLVEWEPDDGGSSVDSLSVPVVSVRRY